MANLKLASVLLIAVIYTTGFDCCSKSNDDDSPDTRNLPEGVVAKGEKGSSFACTDGALAGGDQCKNHKWACTSSRYPWFKNHCKKTCGGCSGNGGGGSGFAQSQLAKTNSYRAKHRAGSLTLDSALTRAVQQYADKMARNNLWEHGGQGENLYRTCSSGSYPSGDRATDSWYSEVSNYNYQTGTSKNGGKIGHFTQMVWNRRNGKFGIARANGIGDGGRKCTWVVARHSPPGNVRGQYTQNVNRP